MGNQFSKLVKSLQIITVLILFSISNNTHAQTYVTWTYGPSGTITGTFPGGTVTATATGIGSNIDLSTPSSYTQFLNATGNRTFSTFGGRNNTPSKKLTFTFSTPVIVTKFNMNDIESNNKIYINYLDYYFRGYPKVQSSFFINNMKRRALEFENEFLDEVRGKKITN